MKESDEERAARQAKLQKALSTAYLSHQIDELETQVQRTHLREKFEEKKGPTIIVDASALLLAPRRVRDAVKAGKDVVIPSEVFHTLDLLKKGSSPTATAARAATRYIEHASRQIQSLRMQQSNQSKSPSLPSGSDTMPPKWVLSTLACVNHFSPGVVLWTAKMPAQVVAAPAPGKKQTKDQDEAEEAELRYGERASGDALRFWAGVCAFQVMVVEEPMERTGKERDAEKEKAKVSSPVPGAEAQPKRSSVQLVRPIKSAPPVLLKRESKPASVQPTLMKREDKSSTKPQSTPPVLLKREPLAPPVSSHHQRQKVSAPAPRQQGHIRTIGRYLDNDDDDEEPRPVRDVRRTAPSASQGGFTLLQRAEEPRARTEFKEAGAGVTPGGPPKIILMQRPK